MHIIRIKLKAEQLNRTFRKFIHEFFVIFRWVNKRETFFQELKFYLIVTFNELPRSNNLKWLIDDVVVDCSR